MTYISGFEGFIMMETYVYIYFDELASWEGGEHDNGSYHHA